jgi:hypothetical protein
VASVFDVVNLPTASGDAGRSPAEANARRLEIPLPFACLLAESWRCRYGVYGRHDVVVGCRLASTTRKRSSQHAICHFHLPTFFCPLHYFLLLYHRYRLFVGDSSIWQTGILSDKHVDLSMIHELKWRCIPQSGSVRLMGEYGELTIELGNLEKQDRLQLIDFLRLTIAESKQVGWQKFNDQFASTPDRQKKSIRAKWLFALIFAAHAVAFGTIWAISGGIQFLVYCVINAGMAVYLLCLYRHKTVGLGRKTGEQ